MTTGAIVVGAAVGGVVGRPVGADVGGARVGLAVGAGDIVGLIEGDAVGSDVLGAGLGGDCVGLIVNRNGSFSYRNSSRPSSTGTRVWYGSITVQDLAVTNCTK